MEWKDWLQKQWDENPGKLTITGIVAAGAIVNVIEALSKAQGRRAYAKQVNYRVKNKR